MPVPKNVRDINIWNTVNCAHRHVESAPKNVIKWQGKEEAFHFLQPLLSYSINWQQ
jgi:hypothetical protein